MKTLEIDGHVFRCDDDFNNLETIIQYFKEIDLKDREVEIEKAKTNNSIANAISEALFGITNSLCYLGIEKEKVKEFETLSKLGPLYGYETNELRKNAVTKVQETNEEPKFKVS